MKPTKDKSKWKDNVLLTWRGEQINSDLIQDFLRHLKSKDCFAAATLRWYRWYIVEFALLLRDNQTPIDTLLLRADKRVAETYTQKLRSECKTKRNISRATCPVRLFYDWLIECQLVANNPFALPTKSEITTPKRNKLSILIQRSYVAKEEAVLEWLGYIKRFSPRTQEGYEGVIRRVLDYLPANIRSLTAKHIEQYIQSLKCSNATKNKNLVAVRSFTHWLADYYDLPNPCLEIRKLPQEPPRQKIITDEQYQRILAACDNQEQRDIVQWLANTGLRDTEFRGLSWQNISHDRKYLTLTGKGRKRRIVPLNDVCRQILMRKNSSNLYLFETYHKYSKLYRLFQDLTKKAGLSFVVSAHTYRHYYTTCLIRAGAKLAIVSKSLGHSEISTTLRIYEHLLPSDVLGLTDILIEEGGKL